MDIKKLQSPLPIESIDFRIQSINKGGYAIILAYKDARVDMKVLDDVCGAENWQRDHKEVKGVVYCGVGVNIEKRTNPTGKITEVDSLGWSWKWDAGSESSAEKEKGESSDSFKRACFNWGIGRELYDYPLISIKLNDDEWNCSDVKNDKTGKVKPKQTWNLKLKEWVWFSQFEDNKLTYLAAKDNNGKKRFEFGTYTKTKNDNI